MFRCVMKINPSSGNTRNILSVYQYPFRLNNSWAKQYKIKLFSTVTKIYS